MEQEVVNKDHISDASCVFQKTSRKDNIIVYLMVRTDRTSMKEVVRGTERTIGQNIKIDPEKRVRLRLNLNS